MNRLAIGSVLALSTLLPSCGSTPKTVLEIVTVPSGADVYLAKSGERAVHGKLGPVAGDVDQESIDESFLLLGTAPLEYTLPLEEKESGASAFGIGFEVVRRYDEGVLRIQKNGYRTQERRIRLEDGDVRIVIELATDAIETDED